MKSFAAFWLIYTAGGFLTAAYYHQHRYERCPPLVKTDPLCADGPIGLCERESTGVHCDRLDYSLPVGLGWPWYWAWRGALIVTR